MTGNAIREALEPIAKLAEILTDDGGWKETDVLELIAEGGDREFVGTLTVGDLRRARTAYDAIGEAGGIWFGRLDDGIRREASAYASEGEAKAAAQADFKRRVLSCLSTDTAAGAGPVGEAVADEGWQPIETAPTGGKFGCFLMLAFGPQGDQTVSEGMHFQGRFYAASVFYTGGPHDTKQFTFREHEVKPTHWRHTLVAPGAARPAEEPSEVEARAQFLLERLESFANGLSDAADVNEYHGHVAPAVARFRAAMGRARAALTGDAQEANR